MQMQPKYLEVPTEEQRESVRKALNCTAESVKRDVQHLIEWFEKQPHLPNYKDEDVLAHSLLHCKNSLEKTKQRLENYFNAKASFPEAFGDRNPFEKAFEDQKNFAIFVPLRKLTPDGYRILILYFSEDAKTKTEAPSVDIFVKLMQMLIELLAKFDYSKGLILLYDGANITMPIVATVTSRVQKILYLQQVAVPVSYAKKYFVNVGKPAEVCIRLSRTFMKKKLTERIEIVKKPTDICNVLPKEIIPREYGGDELPLVQLRDLWYEDLKNNYEYLKYNEKFASDLSKVPKDSTATELSGTTGSFRQIAVD